MLFDLLVIISAAILFVPLFRRFKLGAILAYLFVGVLVGPHLTGLIQDAETILHFSEFGVVFLLFIIGLELAPERLWNLRHSIFGLGLLQVLVTGFCFYLIGLYAGLTSAMAYITGFGLALSSTAFAIQILEENHQLNTTHGQGSFSILMFQDLAVVPLLASLAFFTRDGGPEFSWITVFRIVTTITVLIFVGRYVIRHVLRFIADSHAQEVFTACSLLIVLGTALLMESVGVSMGAGAFLAGVLLANSEYRHELEINLLPFKGLLLGLFFVAVGMSLDINVLLDKPHWILAITLGFMAIKSGLIYGLGRLFRLPIVSSRNMAFTLPQGGEFAFVLFSIAVAQKLMDPEFASILSASVTISMALTPLVFSVNQRWIRSQSKTTKEPYESIKSDEPEVIIAGYGRFGQIVSRFLSAENVKHSVLEHSASQVEAARKFGSKVFYGDASRADILEAAGAAAAKIFVLAIDDPVKSVETARIVKEKFPNLEIIARVRNRQHALDLLSMGIENVHRETYLTSLEVAKEVMLSKGSPREVINKRLAKFRTHDEEIMRKQLEFRDDDKKFVSFTTQANEELRNILRADSKK